VGKNGGLSIGVDLGGTKIEAVALDTRDGSMSILFRERVPTPRDLGYEAIVVATADIARRAAHEAALDLGTTPVGVGMPGSISRRTGLVKNSNTTCLNGRAFRQDLEQLLGREIRFENDANCFALAEARFGAARAFASGVVFGVILGTGVGGGVVLGGRIHDGPQGIAGEWGHHAVWAGRPDARACYCGKRGCFEAHAAGPALEAAYFEKTNERRSLKEIAARTESDPVAQGVIAELLETFGRGLANVIDILDPDAIVLGGGLSNLDVLYERGRERVAHYVFSDELTTPILRHELGDSAGVIGAALLGA
jgi:fructokinase